MFSIYRYGYTKWGMDQADRYQTRLESVFSLIDSNRMLGLAREDIGKGVRLFQVAQHRVVYEIV